MPCCPVHIGELSAGHLNFRPQGLPRGAYPVVTHACHRKLAAVSDVGGGCVGERVVHAPRAAPECGFCS